MVTKEVMDLFLPLLFMTALAIVWNVGSCASALADSHSERLGFISHNYTLQLLLREPRAGLNRGSWPFLQVVPFYLHSLTALLECESDANRSSLKLINLQNWECDTMSEVSRWLEFSRIWLGSNKELHLTYILQLFLHPLQCRGFHDRSHSVLTWMKWQSFPQKSQKYLRQNAGRIRLLGVEVWQWNQNWLYLHVPIFRVTEKE